MAIEQSKVQILQRELQSKDQELEFERSNKEITKFDEMNLLPPETQKHLQSAITALQTQVGSILKGAANVAIDNTTFYRYQP